jgi:N6-adenosine-specific RNA methylase IME4
MKKYQIIYADPPWKFKGYDLKKEARYVGNNYPVQSKEWIEELPINELADKHCILFLWVTMPKLNEVFDLFPKWGFEYKTVAFTWIKKNKK